MNAAVTIRPLRTADIGVLSGVLNRAYRSEQNAELRLRAAVGVSAFATFVAICDGVPVGMVIGNHYGRSAYVSQMAVEPAFQRRGIASRLMDELSVWADDCKFEGVELDATPAGVPLYARYGFITVDRTDVYVSAAGAIAATPAGQVPALAAGERGTTAHHHAPREPVTDEAVRPYDSVEQAAVLAVDRAAFGADRSAVLGLLLDAMPEAVRVIGSAGRIDGYAIAQVRPQMLGPVVAPNARAAGGLIAAATRLLPPVHRLQIPADNLAAARIFADSGYVLVRSLPHMVRGTLPVGHRGRLFARINLGQG